MSHSKSSQGPLKVGRRNHQLARPAKLSSMVFTVMALRPSRSLPGPEATPERRKRRSAVGIRLQAAIASRTKGTAAEGLPNGGGCAAPSPSTHGSVQPGASIRTHSSAAPAGQYSAPHRAAPSASTMRDPSP